MLLIVPPRGIVSDRKNDDWLISARSGTQFTLCVGRVAFADLYAKSYLSRETARARPRGIDEFWVRRES